MKKVNSNLSAWILSSFGAIVVISSIIVSLPTVSKASGSATASCKNGEDVTCYGEVGCFAVDFMGCKCAGQEPVLCQGVREWNE